MDNIILVGASGCGKTAVSRALGNLTGREVFDVDFEIFVYTGRTPAEIVMHDGMDAFRRLEKECVTRLCAEREIIISASAGTVLDEENVNMLRESGKIVFLDRIEPTDADKEICEKCKAAADFTVRDEKVDDVCKNILSFVNFR